MSSWAKWATFIWSLAGTGELEKGTEWGGQISSEILGRSKWAIYSDISWKELAVLPLSAASICGSLVILSRLCLEKWKVTHWEEFPVRLAHLRALFFSPTRVAHSALIRLCHLCVPGLLARVCHLLLVCFVGVQVPGLHVPNCCYW